MENLDRGVAIVGAGYAGMAATVTLAERAIPVTVSSRARFLADARGAS